MSENKIKEIVEQAIDNCPMKQGYGDLSKQVSDVKLEVDKISVALLGNGNKYNKQSGIIEKIEYSYKHSKQCVDTKIVERVLPVVEHFEDWDKNNKWKTINDIIEKYKITLAIGALLISSGVLSVANLITTLVGGFR